MTKIQNIKTILMGTPEFAERIFRNFQPWADQPRAGYQFEIVAVVTAEDKPVGRKQILTPSPVKLWAQENNLPVLQPDKIRKPEWIEKIKELAPDLIILCAYGQIIPQEILDIPKFKALNIHPSLLPKYRGASPIQSVILCGETETGVCLMIMDAEMDHGPIMGISKFKIPASPVGGLNTKISYTELSKELSDLGAELLIKTLPDYIEGKIKPQEQDHSQATVCKLIKKEHGKIDWNKSAEEIERQIRAFSEWPESYTSFNGKQLKIIDADIANKKTDNEIGKVFLDENKNLCVQTNNGILLLKTIQPEGKKPMSARDFLNGHPEIIGTMLK
jgi:methionyl-tRNA formyltransferase